MTFDLEKILESKRALRRHLATRPLAEKLRMLDALRERALTLRAASSPDSTNAHLLREEPDLPQEVGMSECFMATELEQLRAVLLRGIRESKQSAYGRRAPAPESLSELNEARDGLRCLAESTPPDPDVWRLLAQAEECFLNYSEARRCLEQARVLSKTRSRTDLKKLALYTEMEKQWVALRLSAVQLRSLGDYLRRKPQSALRARGLTWTETWLREQHFDNIDEILESLKQRGAFTDFQVLENLVRG